MSDALRLPPRPNLEQYKKLAKDFQKAAKSNAPSAIRDWFASCAERTARLQGREITPELQRQIGYEAEGFEHRWQKFQEKDERAGRCTLAGAQLFVARGHGFASWPKFTQHLAALGRANSPVSQFETAVDAIVDGDIEKLRKLLRENPELVRERSTREHRSTLLHYVSANGVEDFRQKTPTNIIEVTKALLEADADVNAESGAYGGGSTTLMLTATSWHPENAGVQLELMDLLIQNGAQFDRWGRSSDVNACLHNGRGEAAEFLASHGAGLDLEAAAGVGRLDVVKSLFSQDGKRLPAATEKQMKDGFAWACEFGRTAVVEFLLQHGMELRAKLRHDGQTGLHWAAWGGHADIVNLFLQRGAVVDARDESYDGTPLGWALYAWGNCTEREARRGRYYETVALLARAGAKLDPQWDGDDVERQRATLKIQSDPRMQAALRGETPS